MFMSIDIYFLCSINFYFSCKKIIYDYNSDDNIYLIDTTIMNRPSNNINKKKTTQSENTQSSYADSLFKNFHIQKISEIPDYFTSNQSENIIDDFREFIQINYGSNILSSLEKSWEIQYTFEQIRNKWYSLSDLRDPQRLTTIRDYMSSNQTEYEALDISLQDLSSRRNDLSEDSKKVFPIDEFLNQIQVTTKKDQNWNITKIVYNEWSKVQSLNKLESKWNEFVQNKTQNEDLKKIGRDCLPVSKFDHSEKLICATLVNNIASVISSLVPDQRSQINSIFKDVFWAEWWDYNKVTVFTSWVSIKELPQKIKLFLKKLKDMPDGDTLIQKFQDITVHIGDVISYGEANNVLPKGGESQLEWSKKFSQLNKQTQSICEKLFATDVINTIKDTKENMDNSLSDFGKKFDVPGSLQVFFDQFPNCHTEQELRSSIEKKLEESLTILWRPQDGFSNKVVSLLQDLQSKKRKISALSLQDQNMLMKGNITLQLAVLKQQDSIESLWHDFDAYADFVSELYDFENKNSRIKTKSWQYIDINFVSKRFVGEPYQDINLLNIQQWLKPIHVEFELDMTDNMPLKELLKVATGGKYSQLFQSVSDRKNRHLLTESTKVQMKNKDGEIYEWYLSPSFLKQTQQYDENDLWWTGEEYANTFVLYSRPADQHHNDRKVEVDSIWKPIYINPSTSQDWDISILEDRLTLNNHHINALVLWHTIAQQYDQQMRNDLHTTQDTDLASKIEKLKKTSIEHDEAKTLASKDSIESEDKKLKQYADWNNLFPNNNKEKLEPKQWMRFTVQVDALTKSSVVINDPQLLSITIKKVNPDKSIVFSFDTLTRPGECKIPDVTLPIEGIWRLKEVFQDIVYIGDDTTTKDLPYKQMVSHLKESMSSSKNKKQYNFGILETLDLKESTFYKENQPVSFMVPSLQINKRTWWKENYYIDYTVKKIGNKYEVSSSWYASNIGDEKKEEKISYHCKTDLAGLILILAGKQIAPYTATEKKSATDGVDPATVPVSEGKRFGMWMLWKVVKEWVFKKWFDSIKKKLFEEEEEDLKQLLFTESRFYRRLSDGPIGKLLGAFDLDVFDDMASDTEEKSMDYDRSKIEWYQKSFDKFNMVYNAPHGIFGMDNMFQVVKAANAAYPSLSIKQRHMVAAVLLQMLGKMKSWYAKSFDVFPPWTYVKLLMGDQAYSSYLQDYKAVETIALSGSGTVEKNKMNELATLEYNFIVTNTRWWSHHDEFRVRKQWAIPFYFQNVYGRGFANALSDVMWKSADIDDGNVKKYIDWWDFDWTYKDCKEHIFQMRQHDAIEELIALRSLARNKEETDKITTLAMSGILSGAFISAPISSTIKWKLKDLFRSLNLPFCHRIEQPDAPQKLQSILQLATANLWDKSFEKFGYTVGPKENPWPKKPYVFNDFNALKSATKDRQGFVEWFVDWMDGNTWSQVMSFLHMDKSSLDTPDNLLHIRKSKDPNMTIFGQKISPDQKSNVDSMMNELYHNRTRWNDISLDKYNDNSEFSHPATALDSFYTTINNYRNGQWDGKVADHASTARSQLEKNTPSGTTTDRPMMAYHVNEFFRTFAGIWSFSYDKSTIENFYKDIRVAQTMPRWSSDRARVLWFDMTNKLYDKKDVPQTVINTFQRYMSYFEENLDQFDSSLWWYHNQPDDDNKNFTYIFDDSLDYYIYEKQSDWDRLEPKERNAFVRACRESSSRSLNDKMRDENEKKLWIRWSTQNAMWKTVDDLWKELRWWFSTQNETKTFRPPLRIVNDDVDFSGIVQLVPPAIWSRKDIIKRKIDPKYMTEEQKKELERANNFNSLYGDYAIPA